MLMMMIKRKMVIRRKRKRKYWKRIMRKEGQERKDEDKSRDVIEFVEDE